MKIDKFLQLKIVLYFLLGLFSTMPICTIMGKSIFTYLIGIVVGINAIRIICKGSIEKLNNRGILLFFFCVNSLVAQIIGFIYFYNDEMFKNVTLPYIPKIIIYILFFVFIGNEREEYINNIIKGIWCGAVCNIVWTIMDGICYYLFHWSLTNKVFENYAMNRVGGHNYISIIQGGTIRSTGFNIDPAHLGYIIPLVIVVALIRNKKIYIVIAAMGFIFSQSTTSLVASALSAILVMPIICNVRNRKLNQKKFIKYLLVTIIILIFMSHTDIPMILKNGVSTVLNRIDTVYVKNSDDNIRIKYYLYAIPALFSNGILSFTGTGFDTATHAYHNIDSIWNALNTRYFAHDPENLYATYLIDTGIFGFAFYIIMLFMNIRYYYLRVNKMADWRNTFLLAGLCAITFSGLFYFYTFGASQMLILCIASRRIGNDICCSNKLYCEIIKN